MCKSELVVIKYDLFGVILPSFLSSFFPFISVDLMLYLSLLYEKINLQPWDIYVAQAAYFFISNNLLGMLKVEVNWMVSKF